MRVDFLDEMLAEDPQYREAGRVNYESFAAKLGWRRNGEAMRPWTRLEEREKEAWMVAAHDVVQKCWRQSHPQPRHRRQG